MDTEAGTVSAVLLLVKEIAAPPEGAAPVSVIVHVEVAAVPKTVGVQDNLLITTGSVIETVAD